MKIAVAVIATVLQVLTLCNAYAHGDHKPKHGGIMGRGDDGISIELVMEKGTATLYGLTPVPGDRLTNRIILPNGDEFSSIFPFR
jgi:hypothetical protein